MLQLYKNEVVTSSTLQQADVRHKELQLYTRNYWVWGGTSTTLAGFLFEEITSPVPEETAWTLEFVYLFCTASCLGLSLCIITWTVLLCMWGPGMALRGPEGMKSFHSTVEFLKKEHKIIYNIFGISIFLYFGSAITKLWVFPSRHWVNVGCTITLFVILIILVVMQFALEWRIGGGIFPHDGEDGKIHGLQAFEEVTDLDRYLSTKVQPPLNLNLPGTVDSADKISENS
mmetsp:Transcript_124875/g.221250  ORF Transcript_124875/g.221250 Transcript_124875/m.221250 type:complete len:230 (-) Transcript_124875:94-783(-)